MKGLFLRSTLFTLVLFASLTFAKEQDPQIEITAFTSNAAVSNPDQIWDWSSLYLYHKSDLGNFGGILNYARRQNQEAYQPYVNLIPNLNETLWIDLGYGLSNRPALFPNQTYFAELYKQFDNGIVMSAGDAYKRITLTHFNTYTASLARYIGNYYFSFRPYHYIPKAGPKSTLYRFSAKRYWDNPDQNIEIIFATGTSPDLFDLLTVNFFRVKNNIVMLQGQQPIKGGWSVLYGFGYETQLFPNGFLRELTYLNLGIKARFQ